ncbi:MAG: hypothetical protein QNJ31_03715 [Candidatus Caenarcaniphilales bacterium]|nr:hypothetical protein [Candidatus Caenarcaniphilales bacterium]
MQILQTLYIKPQILSSAPQEKSLSRQRKMCPWKEAYLEASSPKQALNILESMKPQLYQDATFKIWYANALKNSGNLHKALKLYSSLSNQYPNNLDLLIGKLNCCFELVTYDPDVLKEAEIIIQKAKNKFSEGYKPLQLLEDAFRRLSYLEEIKKCTSQASQTSDKNEKLALYASAVTNLEALLKLLSPGGKSSIEYDRYKYSLIQKRNSLSVEINGNQLVSGQTTSPPTSASPSNS